MQRRSPVSQVVWMRSEPPASSLPDADLWRRLRSADSDAFRALFQRHSTAVYNFCFRRTASWSSAEDATQATFATLWRRARSGAVEELRLESARPVLCAMARDECSNVNRTRERHLHLVERVQGAGARSADNTADWVESEATMATIRRALAVLPANQRDVVELVAWAELPLAEVAAALALPVGTVKSRLSRARARLATSEIAALFGEQS
jgi:RNA polymerase sigma-70 factor, ECF subfamily